MSKVRKVKRGGVSFSSKEEDAEARKAARATAKIEAVSVASEYDAVLPGQMEWEMSPSIARLAKAFVAFRKVCPNMEKDRQGYSYKYTTLGNVIGNSRDPLNKNGLAITQLPIAGKGSLGVITCLMHESGEFIRGRFLMPIPQLSGTNVTQDAGAAISYARRYALSAVLCVASDDDTDASFGRDDNSEAPRGRGKTAIRKRR